MLSVTALPTVALRAVTVPADPALSVHSSSWSCSSSSVSLLLLSLSAVSAEVSCSFALVNWLSSVSSWVRACSLAAAALFSACSKAA